MYELFYKQCALRKWPKRTVREVESSTAINVINVLSELLTIGNPSNPSIVCSVTKDQAIQQYAIF